MAMELGDKRGGIKADINVTPLVDIVLVLLIIFIVITPAVNNAVKLPVARHSVKPETQPGVKYLNLMLPRDNQKSRPGAIVPGLVILDDAKANSADKGVRGWDMMSTEGRDRLVHFIHTHMSASHNKRVFVKADADLPYKYVDRLFQICREGGADEASIITGEDKKDGTS